MRRYRTRKEVHERAIQAIGVKFGAMDRTGRLATGKGSIGTVLEESHFDVPVNSRPEADFREAGVELKATPYRRHSDGSATAKERLVLNIIDYCTEYRADFESSSFWTKNQCLEMMFYEHHDNRPKAEYYVDHCIQYTYPPEDLEVIRADWRTIVEKVRQGKAHELSESDTLYLGACTKGANRNSVRPQPFSDILAQQRAYCLKQPYMTYILQTYVLGGKPSQQILTDADSLRAASFEGVMRARLLPFFGKTQAELAADFGIRSTPKDLSELLLGAMLGIKGKVSHSAEFLKAGIAAKTIRLEHDGRIRESMSFPAFRFLDLIHEGWDTSTLKAAFEATKYLFVIFQSDANDNLVFRDIMLWNMPPEDLEEVRRVWTRTVKTIRDGVVLTETARGTMNNLPKMSENRVCHVRPHAANRNDTYPLPDGRLMPKQCFWLNHSYVRDQIERRWLHQGR